MPLTSRRDLFKRLLVAPAVITGAVAVVGANAPLRATTVMPEVVYRRYWQDTKSLVLILNTPEKTWQEVYEMRECGGFLVPRKSSEFVYPEDFRKGVLENHKWARQWHLENGTEGVY
jgi:hypothetical protein